MDQQNNEDRDYPAAYFPVPKRVITVKQEPKESEEDDEGCNSGEQVILRQLLL